VPDEFNAVIAATLAQVKLLASRIDPNLYKTMTVFVDPIDGTREFATAQVRAKWQALCVLKAKKTFVSFAKSNSQYAQFFTASIKYLDLKYLSRSVLSF